MGLGFDLTPIATITQKISGSDILLSLAPIKPTRMVIRCLVDLLQQLQQLHRLGIYHRDIKADNVLQRRVGNFLHGYIIDFGLAYINVNQDHRKRIISNHTPEKHAPIRNYALARGALTPEKSDVGAFGMMLLTLITRKSAANLFAYDRRGVWRTKCEIIALKNQPETEERNNKLFNLVAELNSERNLDLRQPQRDFTPDLATRDIVCDAITAHANKQLDPVMLDFLYRAVSPDLDARYDTTQLLAHPFLATARYTNVYEKYQRRQPPIDGYRTSAQPYSIFNRSIEHWFQIAIVSIKRLADKNINFSDLRCSIVNHSVNLLIRVIKARVLTDLPPALRGASRLMIDAYQQQNPGVYLHPGNWQLLVVACFTISRVRLSDAPANTLTNAARELMIDLPDFFDMIEIIVNGVDCDCSIEGYSTPVDDDSGEWLN
jgi:serine/threonine protein kinase